MEVSGFMQTFVNLEENGVQSRCFLIFHTRPSRCAIRHGTCAETQCGCRSRRAQALINHHACVIELAVPIQLF